ncbi:MAG TPA: hypothetical protein ENO11_00270 [Desulfobacteraceae bacterium]|nr:hypothetical protein [Desulfobacteraceae bacterium]
MYSKKIFFLFIVLALSFLNLAVDAKQSDESRLITLPATSLEEPEATMATGTAKPPKPAPAARNLFNKDAREPRTFNPNAQFGAWIAEDYPLQGREFRAELRFTC